VKTGAKDTGHATKKVGKKIEDKPKPQ
jgi:hypothetical protein